MTRVLTDYIKETIIKSPNKSCDLEPVPLWLLEKCKDQLPLMIRAVINKSVTNCIRLSGLNSVTIMLLLKRSRIKNEAVKIIKLYQPFLSFFKFREGSSKT